jgi:hypothetical protein
MNDLLNKQLGLLPVRDWIRLYVAGLMYYVGGINYQNLMISGLCSIWGCFLLLEVIANAKDSSQENSENDRPE